ncbi:MAG: hypothetical protein WCV92_00740 [Candidatus Buchananbacteria bacterium]
METKTGTIHLTRDGIQELIPHRDDALLIDNAAVDPETNTATSIWTAIGVLGHYPDMPLTPGHITDEALALLCGVLYKQCHPDTQGKPVLFSKEMRYWRPITPGQTVTLNAKYVGLGRGGAVLIFDVKATILVNGREKDAVIGTISACIVSA